MENYPQLSVKPFTHQIVDGFGQLRSEVIIDRMAVGSRITQSFDMRASSGHWVAGTYSAEELLKEGADPADVEKLQAAWQSVSIK
jgi:hypothetical protein